MQILQLESLSLSRISQDLVGKELLEDLSMVDLLLNCAGRHQSIDLDLSLLSQSPSSLASLNVGGRVPVRIVDDDTISSCEVDTETADLRGEEEDMQVWVVVELINESLSIFDGGVAVHATIIEAFQVLDEELQDVQHDTMLSEEKSLVAVTLPDLEERLDDLHFARLVAGTVGVAGFLAESLVLRQIWMVADLS